MDMMLVDQITGGFQFFASIFIMLNIRALLKSREMKGISLLTIVFYNLWDFWGVYMFYRIGNSYSMWTAVAITVVYTTWSCLVFYFTLSSKESPNESSVSKREKVHLP